MATELAEALSKVQTAASVLFEADASVRSVGVGAATDAFGYVAVRNTNAPMPLSKRLGIAQFPQQIEGIPVRVVNSIGDPHSLVRVPHSGIGSPGVVSLIPEQQYHRPLVCGLQIQNYDQDARSGDIASGYMIVGTLGCFVTLATGGTAVLSNNHVVAGENSAAINDVILQPGSSATNPALNAAALTNFVALKTSPTGASIVAGTVVFNEVDAGVAEILSGIQPLQSYLPARTAFPPKGHAAAAVNDQVHKVGRTTGLTYGTVTQIGVVVGPISYTPGECWFRQCFIIEGLNGATFSDHGDSGSVIVRADGTVLGLLFAGNGTQTYACDIGDVLRQLNCTVT
jgi:hypothetical protein